MSIIVRFILKNIFEKKFRTALIIVSIMLSTALFFASTAMTNTMTKMFEDRMRQFYGSTQILITANEKSPSGFFNMKGTEAFKEKLEYCTGMIQGSAVYKPSYRENVNLQLFGFKLDELQKINPLAFYSSELLDPFEGRKVIVSKTTADKYGLKVGDTFELNVGAGRVPFTICALTYPSGLFLDESQAACAIVPLETLSSIYNVKGRVNGILAKTLDPADKKAVMAGLADAYERYTVKEPFTLEELAQQTSSMTTGFLLMTMVVMLMSIFIIFTSFKVVTMERLPVVGIFRSVGATRRKTDGVLLAESLLYGIIGGTLGLLLGMGILYLMSYFSRPVYAVGFHTTIAFSTSQLVTAFLLAMVLSFVSCILPILQIGRIPVKDVILNVMQKVVKKTTWKFYLGLLMIAAAIIIPQFTPLNLAVVVNSSCMMLSVGGVILLVPYLTALIVKVLEKLYGLLFGNIGLLAAKNLRQNKSILNNISLLAIGISSLLMINTISGSVMKEVTNVYGKADFNIWVQYMQQGNRDFESIVRQVEGVNGTYGIYEAFGVEMEGLFAARINELEGVNSSKYNDYWKFDYSEDVKSLFGKLEAGKNIIITDTIKDKYKLKLGDTVNLRLRDKSRPYTIVGFVNTIMDNGSLALISEKNLIMDTGNRYYANLYVKTTKDPDQVLGDIKKRLGQRPYYMQTVKQMEDQNNKSNENVFTILKGFSLMAFIIGVFGILNNLMISFIERKRALAVLRSVGMSRKQTVGMIFVEALSGGIIGGISGSIAGFLLIWGIPYVLKAINLSVPLHFPWGETLYYILAGVLITVAASVSPALKSSKLNVIEAIKYE